MSFQLKKKKLGMVAHFWEEICKNHIRQNVGKEKQKSTCFGIFYKLFQLKFPHCIPISYLFLVYSKKGTKN
jgi:hypothetical protein